MTKILRNLLLGVVAVAAVIGVNASPASADTGWSNGFVFYAGGSPRECAWWSQTGVVFSDTGQIGVENGVANTGGSDCAGTTNISWGPGAPTLTWQLQKQQWPNWVNVGSQRFYQNTCCFIAAPNPTLKRTQTWTVGNGNYRVVSGYEVMTTGGLKQHLAISPTFWA